jgi:hypothetical protein
MINARVRRIWRIQEKLGLAGPGKTWCGSPLATLHSCTARGPLDATLPGFRGRHAGIPTLFSRNPRMAAAAVCTVTRIHEFLIYFSSSAADPGSGRGLLRLLGRTFMMRGGARWIVPGLFDI